MKVVIELPGIIAVSRNKTTGHYIKYSTALTQAEQWMIVYGKAKEHHFTSPVDVTISAYLDTRSRRKIIDSPNIDDKIFTDTLVRWKRQKYGPAIERPVWFIEDDNPNFLRSVHKRAIPDQEYKVVIEIEEIHND